MRQLIVMFFLSLTIGLAGCSEPEEPLRGWEESDVEVIEPGETGEPARQVVAPGEAPLTTPMTATSVDTSTDLEMIDDEALAIETSGGGSTLADRLDDAESARPVTGEMTGAPRTGGTSRPASPQRRAESPQRTDTATRTTTRANVPTTTTTTTTTESTGSGRPTRSPGEELPPERSREPDSDTVAPDDQDEEQQPEGPAGEIEDPSNESERPETTSQPETAQPEAEPEPPVIEETPTPVDDDEPDDSDG